MSKILNDEELKELTEKVIQKVTMDVLAANENGTLKELLEEYELLD